MANGFCPAILDNLEMIAGRAYPGNKATKQGFLLSLLNSVDQPMAVSDVLSQNGHIKTVQYKYKVRSVVGQVSDSLSCDNNIVDSYKQTAVTLPYQAQITTFFNDETVRQYCNETSAAVTAGTPPTQLMSVVLEGILSSMTGLYAKMETDLTTSMATQFGLNKRTNSTTPTLNLPLTGTSNNLSEGLYALLSDAVRHEYCANPVIVGSGLFTNFHLGQMAKAFGLNQSGVDAGMMAEALGYAYYNSQIAATTWGSNEIGMFDAGAAHLVQYNRNKGAWVGDKGASWFARISDPRVQCWTPGGYQNVEFDLQVKYLDCPQSVRNDYTGVTSTYDRGYLVMVSTSYGLFVNPTDAYDGQDVLAGQNGTLNYAITNA